MARGGGTHELDRPVRRRAVRGPVDGLIAGGKEVWVLVASPEDNVASLLRPGPLPEQSATVRVARAVLDGGIVLIGSADPSTDPLLSDLMKARNED